MPQLNRDFKATIIKPSNLPPDVPSSIVPTNLGSIVEFESDAASWLLAAVRNVMLDYVPVKHLKLQQDTNSFSSDDRSLQHFYIERFISTIICHESTPNGAQFVLDYKNKTPNLVNLTTALFTPTITTGSSRNCFEPTIFFTYLHPGSSIHISAEVVEEPGMRCGTKAIVTNFAYNNEEIVRLSLDRNGIDQVWVDRAELDQPPFKVRLQMHADRTLKSLIKSTTDIIQQHLQALDKKLALDGAPAIAITEHNVDGRGFNGVILNTDEPRDHVIGLLGAFIQDVEDKLADATASATADASASTRKYLQCKPYFDAITKRSSLKIVFRGTETELAVDLRAHIKNLAALISSFQGPDN